MSFEKYEHEFQITGRSLKIVERIERLTAGVSSTRLTPLYEGLPIERGELPLHFSATFTSLQKT
jgi:hypothetical protein